MPDEETILSNIGSINSVSPEEDVIPVKADEKPAKSVDKRKSYLFQPGNSGNPFGRPKDTEEDKVRKTVIKKLVKEYKSTLADYLKDIAPVLKKEAMKGSIPAIREINDRVLGKARETVGLDGGEDKPIPILSLPEVLGRNEKEEETEQD